MEETDRRRHPSRPYPNNLVYFLGPILSEIKDGIGTDRSIHFFPERSCLLAIGPPICDMEYWDLVEFGGSSFADTCTVLLTGRSCTFAVNNTKILYMGRGF